MIVFVSLIERASCSEFNIKDRWHGRREPANKDVVDRLFTVPNMPGDIRDDRAERRAATAPLQNRLVVIEGDVFALLAFQKLVNIGNDGCSLINDEHVGAEIEDFLRHVPIDTADKSDYSDHGCHADHDSKQREDRTQLIRPERLQRDADSLEEIHLFSLSIPDPCLLMCLSTVCRETDSAGRNTAGGA